MAMTPRLEMRQGQALVMTPQLQQAIKLLQLSNVELQEFVEGELERNPLLEREEGSAEAPKAAADGGDAQALDFDTGVAPAEAALDVSVADMAPDLSANELAEAGAAPMTDWSKAGSGKGFVWAASGAMSEERARTAVQARRIISSPSWWWFQSGKAGPAGRAGCRTTDAGAVNRPCRRARCCARGSPCPR